MSGSRTAVATHSTKFSNFSKSDDTEVGPMVQKNQEIQYQPVEALLDTALGLCGARGREHKRRRKR